MKRFKSFKMSETTFNQINSLPEKMQLKYYRAVCEYGLNGIEPDFYGVENSVFIPMRDLIDYSNDRSRINADNGKKGGAPAGNNNRNQAKSSDINLFQATLEDVAQEARMYGFFVEPKTAQDFLDSGLDSLWLLPPYSFFEFVAERIKNKYEAKPFEELKAMFIAAVKSKDGTWDDLRQEYPEWKIKKERQDRATAKKTAIETARENHPRKCVCGNTLREYNGSYGCDSCNFIFEFNEESLTWERKETSSESLSMGFENLRRERELCL